MLSPHLAVVLPVAEDPSQPARYVDPSIVSPGLLGFVIFTALGVATFFLWRSMNKQLKKIDFEEPDNVRPVNAPFTRADQTPAVAPGAEPKGPGSTP